jgi:predicted dehydrogenase
MKSVLRWGILGTGMIAGKFAEELPFSETGRLVAVGSRTIGGAQAFANRFGGVRAHGDYASLLADPEVDAVYISTPHPFHAQWACAAARAGKHILCEKPLAMSVGEVQAVVDEARRAGVFLMEAFMYKCHPRTARIAELVREGAVGKVRLIEAVFSFAAAFDPESRLFNKALGGGGILDVGCYTMSVARMVAGAASGKLFENPSRVLGATVPAPTGVDSLAAATLEFPGGVLGQVFCGVGLLREHDLQIVGEEGRIRVPHFWNPPGQIEVYRGDELTIESASGSVHKYALEADAVAQALPGFESPHMSWEDSLGNAAALDAWRAV